MDYTLVKQVRDNAPLRESFFALARRVFGLSFEEWHRAGWWTDRYVPYTMVYRDGSAAGFCPLLDGEGKPVVTPSGTSGNSSPRQG